MISRLWLEKGPRGEGFRLFARDEKGERELAAGLSVDVLAQFFVEGAPEVGGFVGDAVSRLASVFTRTRRKVA